MNKILAIYYICIFKMLFKIKTPKYMYLYVYNYITKYKIKLDIYFVI